MLQELELDAVPWTFQLASRGETRRRHDFARHEALERETRGREENQDKNRRGAQIAQGLAPRAHDRKEETKKKKNKKRNTKTLPGMFIPRGARTSAPPTVYKILQ